MDSGLIVEVATSHVAAWGSIPPLASLQSVQDLLSVFLPVLVYFDIASPFVIR